MPSGNVSIEIACPATTIFDLIHNYDRRLEWDPFLREAKLLNKASRAAVGVCSRCTARWSAGGMAMDTEYVTLDRPRVAAVKMTRGPLVFRSFAASIREEECNDITRVTYCYNFSSQPRWLAPVMEPVIQHVFRRETRGRLAALKKFLEAGRGA